MIALGYFFLVLIGPVEVRMGAYADIDSCMRQARMMAQAGEQVMSVCYAARLPDQDDTVELGRDPRS